MTHMTKEKHYIKKKTHLCTKFNKLKNAIVSNVKEL